MLSRNPDVYICPPNYITMYNATIMLVSQSFRVNLFGIVSNKNWPGALLRNLENAS